MKKTDLLLMMLTCIKIASAQTPPSTVQPILTPGVLKGMENRPLSTVETQAERGDASAQYEMGMAYLGGNFVEKDLSKAAQWFHLAAFQGDVRSMVRLGYLLESGRGIKQNTSEAARLYKEAANQGSAEGQARYALMLESGTIGKKNNEQAYVYFLLAAQGGEEIGEQGVERIQRSLSPRQKESARTQARNLAAQMPRTF